MHQVVLLINALQFFRKQTFKSRRNFAVCLSDEMTLNWKSMLISIALNDLINISQDEKPSSVNRHHHYGNHISDLKFKILRDKTYEKNLQDFNLPPYLRKRNRRFKSIYETMHENDFAKKSKLLKPSPYFGHLEYQQFLHKNEIPEKDLIAELLQKSMKKTESDHKHHHKKHHYSRSHQKIKKYRSKPEVGIMQKKLKLVH